MAPLKANKRQLRGVNGHKSTRTNLSLNPDRTDIYTIYIYICKAEVEAYGAFDLCHASVKKCPVAHTSVAVGTDFGQR